MATHVDGTVLDWNAVAAEHPEYFLADSTCGAPVASRMRRYRAPACG